LAVGDFNGTTAQQRQGGAEAVGGLGGGVEALREPLQRQAGFAAAVGAILGGELGALFQIKESLELADDFAAGGQRIEGLPEQAPESAPPGVVPVPAVGTGGGLGKEAGGHELGQPAFQLAEG
jgi:hypothetical protein